MFYLIPGGIDISPIIVLLAVQFSRNLLGLNILASHNQEKRYLQAGHRGGLNGFEEGKMSAKLIDGKAFSNQLVDRIARQVSLLQFMHHFTPGLAVILVGEDPASQVYVRNKAERTKKSGMRSIEHRLAEQTSQEELLALIDKMNRDEAIDGILVQLPLPAQIDDKAVIQAIAPEKDVDGFHVVNAGLLATGQPGIVPCTPYGCLLLLQDHFGDLSWAECGNCRPLQYCWQTDGPIIVKCQCNRNHCPFPHQRAGENLSASRYSGCRCRPAGNDYG